MKLKIYHNPRCSKSRETLEILKKKDASFEVIEYLKTVPSEKELKELVGLLGIPVFELVRTTEDDFKTHFKGKQLSDDEWIKAMVLYPKLIQRPIVVGDGKAVIGRPPERVLDLV